MKVYKVEDSEDTTYFCFNGSKEDALVWYLEEGMVDKNDTVSIELFPRKNWKEVKIKFEEYKIKPFSMTIEEYMQGQTSNEIICSTDWL